MKKATESAPNIAPAQFLYEEVIEVALKDLFDHFWQEKEIPSYEQYMVVARDAFWGARMEQMCCQLNKNVPLHPCVEPATITFIRTYGCDDNEIPSSVGRKNFTIDYPPREALSGVLRASLVMTRMTLRPTSC
jgi:hypothetical protein